MLSCDECRNWRPYINYRRSGSVRSRQRWTQLNLRASGPSWSLQAEGVCEHVSPMQLLLAAAKHERNCPACIPQQRTVAEHFDSILPGVLKQPVHRYENIKYHSEILREHSRPAALTAEMMPHLHPSDPPVQRRYCVFEGGCSLSTCYFKMWAKGYSRSCCRWEPLPFR